MKTANGRIIQQNCLDQYSLKVGFALVPVDVLKAIAQRLREDIDWYGENHNNSRALYISVLEVIKISEPNFETEFMPSI